MDFLHKCYWYHINIIIIHLADFKQPPIAEFLGAKAPLEIASVSQSVSQSPKSLEIAVNVQSDVSRDREKYQVVLRGIKSYQDVSRGIEMYQEVSRCIKTLDTFRRIQMH